MAALLEALRSRGYGLLEKVDSGALDGILAALGEVVQVVDVVNDPETPALVTSAEALDYHTDHPRVDCIAWRCIKQAAEGGESILADAALAFAQLPAADQAALAEVRLFEHKVFPDDADSQPLVSWGPDGRRRFYYSFWLVKDQLPAAQRQALRRFRSLVPACQLAEFRLQPDDLLVVDNTRILHGRRAFTGNERRLIRYWIRHSR